jgi:transcriptional regulator with XRE-family HTH domain
MDIGARIRAARKEAGLSQEELARRADMSLNGMASIERGGITDPHYSTLSKIAKGLGVSPHWLYSGDEAEESAIIKKAPAPTSSTPAEREAMDEERRTIYDALQSLEMSRVADYDREVTASDSPHFRDATAATLWIDWVQRDATRWADWVIKEASTLAPLETGTSLKENLHNAFKVSGPLMEYDRVIREGRRRLEKMGGQVDEFTKKMFEKSTQDLAERRESLSA